MENTLVVLTTDYNWVKQILLYFLIQIQVYLLQQLLLFVKLVLIRRL